MSQDKQKPKRGQAAKKAKIADELAILQYEKKETYAIYRANLGHFRDLEKRIDEKLTQLRAL